VAVVCLGVWGWARADAARFQADAARQLEGALAASGASGAELEASALERAVDEDLRRLAAGAPGDGVAADAVAVDGGGA
jgi:hypothetical protein